MALFNSLVNLAPSAVAQGLFLALLGVSITLVFGLGEVLNLAFGMIAVVGLLASVTVINSLASLPLGVVAGILAAGLLGLTIDKGLLTFIYQYEEEERIQLGIFVTLGVTLFLEGVLINYYSLTYSFPVSLSPITLGGVSVASTTIVTILATSGLLIAIFAFLRFTETGTAMRTVFQDEVGAVVCGIPVRRMRTMIFVLSSLIAGAAGMIYSLDTGVSVSSGFHLTILGLIVSISGGVRSVGGAVVAGILLGFVQTYTNFFLGSYVAEIVLFVIVILMILANPELGT